MYILNRRVFRNSMAPRRKTRRARQKAGRDAEDRTQALHLALHLGLQAQNATQRAAPSQALECKTTPPILAVGVMTAPRNEERRDRLRRSRLELLQDEPCAATLTFVLGKRNMMPADARAALIAEGKAHRDLVYLNAHDGISPGMSHGGRAVASKALAWYIYAVNATLAPFVAKLDDDTMPHLERLVGEMRAVAASVPTPGFAYYGVMVYRLWDWGAAMAGTPNAACGGHGDDGPPGYAKGTTLYRLKRARSAGNCQRSIGPFPFPDGSLEVVGRRLLTAVFGSRRVHAFAKAAFEKRQPPFWTHEDAGLGALVHREGVACRSASLGMHAHAEGHAGGRLS